MNQVRKDRASLEAHGSRAVFSQPFTVRFSNCDPAGIVFFPQYFVLLNSVVEDWFTLALGIDYAHLIGHQRIGLPTVSLQCDFLAPSRMGEKIEFKLRVGQVGKRSLTVDAECVGIDGIRLRLRQVLVTTSLLDHRAIDIPADVLSAISRWEHSA
jgi:4-hydroxybenzoyl-CoA thioesterase